MLKLEPQYLTLNALLAERLFRIPRYQRAYSWTAQQRDELFSDISSLRNKPDIQHFMATVVCLYRETKEIVTDEFKIVDVVDGQQRLTTLVLLLKALEKSLDRNNKDENRLSNQLRDLLVKQDSASLILLQTNHDSSHYFQNYLRNGVCPDASDATSLADRELAKAMAESEEFVKKWDDDIELLGIVKNRLSFILHTIDDEAAVYTVFEVLNSRGLPVAALDRLKSTLMSVIFEHGESNAEEHIDELHNLWGDIYKAIGLKKGMGDEALLSAATLSAKSKPSKPIRRDNAVSALSEQCGSSPAKAIEISNFLLKIVRGLNEFLGASEGPAR